MSWIKIFSWLVYSEVENGALCKFCVLFSNSDSTKGSHEKTKFLHSHLKNEKCDREIWSCNMHHKLSKECAEYVLQ